MRAFVPAFLLLAGCAATSGVYETSPGVYAVSGTAAVGGLSAATGKAMKMANGKCSDMGKRVEVVDQTTNVTIESGTASVTFRCV